MRTPRESRAELTERLRRRRVDNRVERSPSITRKTRNEVDVEVRHGLPGRTALIDAKRQSGGSEHLSKDTLNPTNGEKERSDSLGRKIEESLRVDLRHDECVPECARVNVEEGDRILVLVENLRRSTARSNRAEETVWWSAHGEFYGNTKTNRGGRLRPPRFSCARVCPAEATFA